MEIVGTQPGERTPGDSGDAGGEVGVEPGPTVPTPPPVDDCSPTDPTSCAAAPAAPEDEVLRPTLNDVASFAPAALALTDEPDGVGIVGMPVNFVVTATAHEQTGELFDLPVTVRFTPDSVVFSYGDGATRTAADGGRSLSALGLPQFSATPTSHAYAARGTYTASALVRYAAEVDFGSGWVPVPGLLAIPTANATIDVLEARTALVDRTCIEDPAGVGC